MATDVAIINAWINEDHYNKSGGGGSFSQQIIEAGGSPGATMTWLGSTIPGAVGTYAGVTSIRAEDTLLYNTQSGPHKLTVGAGVGGKLGLGNTGSYTYDLWAEPTAMYIGYYLTTIATINTTRWQHHGTMRMDTLSGVGSRMVVADANGDLSTQPLTIVYPATTLTVPISDGVTGDIDSVAVAGDADILQVEETNGNPGYQIEFDFANVDSFNNILAWVYYHGGAGHTINIELYNPGTDTWVPVYNFTDESQFTLLNIPIVDGSTYVDSAGEVELRFYHDNNGILSHYIEIDYLVLRNATDLGGGGGVTDHGNLSGLDDDDHSQYALLSGRGGETLVIDGINFVDGDTSIRVDSAGAMIFEDTVGGPYELSELFGGAAHGNHTGHVTSSGLATTVVVAAITGQTALDTGLAGTDELLVNDGGAIKRMDISVVQAYMQSNLSFGEASPLTTKGDVYTFSTVDARLPIGTNGDILSANSAEITGLEWIPSPETGIAISQATGDIAAVNFANTENNLSWTAVGTVAGASVSISGDVITIDSDGTYTFTVTLRTANNNRTELFIRTYIDTGGGYAQDTAAQISNYVSRDTDQDTGGLILVYTFELTAGDLVQFRGFGDCDGTCTGLNDGTVLLVREEKGVKGDTGEQGPAGAGMVYPTGSGIPIVVSGTSWGTTITNNSANWNTAYGWGDHAGLYNNYTHPDHSGHVSSDHDGATVLLVEAIEGQFFITSGLDSNDEFIASVDGSLRRMETSVIEEYMQDNLAFNNYSHPNHSGHVSSAGDGAQTLLVASITGQTATTTLTGTDEFLVNDGGAIRRVDVNRLIVGQAAELTSGLVSTDELLVSDAGTIKRMDVSVIEAYMQANLSFGGGYTHPDHSGHVSSSGDGATLLLVEAIEGQFFTTSLDSDDEFIAAVDGSLRRLDVSVIETYMQNNLSFNNYSHPNHSGHVTSSGDGATILRIAAITGQINTTSVTSTSELVINAGGAIRRVDMSYVKAYIQSTEFVADTGASYTFVLTDAGKVVTLSDGSAITLTVPTNAAVAFPIGTTITIIQIGAGQVTIAGAGVTLRSADGALSLRSQYSSASLIKRDTDEWYIVGDIEA